MSRLRQLPGIYIRGSIANVTMKNMTLDDQKRVADVVEQLVNSPTLSNHRREYTRRLSLTIGADYKDVSINGPADEEFYIAVWRATVYLLCHSNYTFKCEACKQSQYLTQRSKPKNIDRCWPICPACEHVKIENPGDSKFRPGAFAHIDKVRAAIATGNTAPTHSSPIVPVKGAPKVPNPEAILADKDQLSKFYTEFCWNYYRQTLNENIVRYHGAHDITVAGPADQVAVEEVLSLFAKLKYPHNYQQKGNPYAGAYHVIADVDAADASVVERLHWLTMKYERLGVHIEVNDREVVVQECRDAPNVEALVIQPQVVALLTNSPRIGGDEGDSSPVDTNLHKIIRGRTMSMSEDGIAQMEANDLLDAIRNSLPDGAQQVLEIVTQQGETWERYSEEADAEYDRTPCPAQMARFLRVKPRQVQQWLQNVRVQCIAHGLSPAGV